MMDVISNLASNFTLLLEDDLNFVKHGHSIAWSNVFIGGAIELILQWILFIFAIIFKTEKFYDLGGTFGFLCEVVYSFGFKKNTVLFSRKTIASLMVMLWTLKLGGFLFYRVLTVGEDKRFEKVKHQPLRFFIYWTVQALWVFITALPVLILNSTSPLLDQPVGYLMTDYIGLSLWIVGITFETTADVQKFAFKQHPQNEGKWISTGVWKLCRYPNYFGEIVLWLGLFLFTFAGLPNNLVRGVSAISPAFVAFLLIFLSGIPILEATHERKYGKNPAYQQYKRNTPLLIPFFK